MSTPDDGLSKYELERLDNIRRNQEHLTYLGLEAAPSASARRETKRPRREPSLRPQVAPSRSSARIEGASAPDVFVESETAHGIVTVGGDGGAWMAEHQVRESARSAAAAALDPLAAFGLGAMPASESELLDGEREAYAALRAAKNVRAGEEGTAAYHIAQNRTLCELVRAQILALALAPTLALAPALALTRCAACPRRRTSCRRAGASAARALRWTLALTLTSSSSATNPNPNPYP